MKSYNDRLIKLEGEHQGGGCVSCITFGRPGNQRGTINIRGARYDFEIKDGRPEFVGLTGDQLKRVMKIYHQPRATYGINPPAKTNEF